VAGQARRTVRRLLQAAQRRSPRAKRAIDAARRVRDALRNRPQSRPRRASGPLAPVVAMLPQRSPRVVVVLASAESDAQLRGWLGHFTGDRVHVLAAERSADWSADSALDYRPAVGPEEMHEALKRIGPVDVVLDMCPGHATDFEQRWKRLFLHLRNGGAYVISRQGVNRRSDQATLTWAAGLLAAQPAGAPISTEFAAAASTVAISADAVLIGKRFTHHLKLRDAETNDVLPQREPQLRLTELATVPGGAFESRATVVQHLGDTEISWPANTITYPELHLRHYQGRIGFVSHALFHTERSILPDSFRWHLYRDPGNPKTVNVTEAFARIDPAFRPRTALAGRYYHLDPQHGGFGHIMTEMVSRLWGWQQAKDADPDLKAIFSVVHPKSARRSAKYRILRAYGIAEDDIVWTSRPVWLHSLVSATAMWHNNEPYSVHPGIETVWERLRTELIDPDVRTYDKVFISRSAKFSRRTCRNAELVEKLFESHGFTIFYPEDVDLSVQAAVFAGARVIAGFAGSGLFNILFARNVETTIILSQDAYYHRNEHLFTSLLGGTVHYFWSMADKPHAESDNDDAASRSSWEFDFTRHGAALSEVLDSL
jgi:capsular polysaccharide biosynthesis protein